MRPEDIPPRALPQECRELLIPGIDLLPQDRESGEGNEERCEEQEPRPPTTNHQKTESYEKEESDPDGKERPSPRVDRVRFECSRIAKRNDLEEKPENEQPRRNEMENPKGVFRPIFLENGIENQGIEHRKPERDRPRKRPLGEKRQGVEHDPREDHHNAEEEHETGLRQVFQGHRKGYVPLRVTSCQSRAHKEEPEETEESEESEETEEWSIVGLFGLVGLLYFLFLPGRYFSRGSLTEIRGRTS